MVIFASDGKINLPLAKALTRVYDAFRETRPSLGREIFEQKIRSLIDNEKIDLA